VAVCDIHLRHSDGGALARIGVTHAQKSTALLRLSAAASSA